MPDLCIGFEVHQPYRLNRIFSPDPKVKQKDLDTLYFDAYNRDMLQQISDRCYLPATRILLEQLDEGLSCAFSLSGVLIEQLEKWNPDVLSLFDQVARHKNTELLAQTYYHSIASLFADTSEFEEQVKMHVDLMHDLFHVHPVILENTELIFDNKIAVQAKQMDFTGIITEGIDHIPGWNNPNYLYSCCDVPVFLRNTSLSDDISYRFANPGWNKFPLTAETYADWFSLSQGDIITLLLDYEVFGEHCKKESGIFQFLQYLPVELQKKGISTILPSEAVVQHSPVRTIDVEKTISRAGIEKDLSAWIGNERQFTAYSAIQKAKPYAMNQSIWRYLQMSDHFACMGSSCGTNGEVRNDVQDEVHQYFSHYPADDAFRIYMQILADFEKRCIRLMKSRKSAQALRTLPPDKAFRFCGPTGYCGYTAYNLDQFYDLLHVVPVDSIGYHQERGDFVRWIDEQLQDPHLAEQIKTCTQRQEIIAIVGERKETLWKPLR